MNDPFLPLELDEEPTPQIKIDYKSKDMELYNRWKQSKSRGDMSRLVNHLDPIIYKAVSTVSGSVPTSALTGEAKVWTIKAIKSFDPGRGFALSTHVTNYIKRIKRLNYKYQNVARLPEHMQREYHMWNTAKQQLSDELNGEPSTEEMAKRLGWTKPKVERFNSRVYSDLAESSEEHPSEVTRYSDNDLLMKALISHLTENEKFILLNKGKISSSELAAKLGYNTNRLNYEQKKLVDKISLLKVELGL